MAGSVGGTALCGDSCNQAHTYVQVPQDSSFLNPTHRRGQERLKCSQEFELVRWQNFPEPVTQDPFPTEIPQPNRSSYGGEDGGNLEMLLDETLKTPKKVKSIFKKSGPGCGRPWSYFSCSLNPQGLWPTSKELSQRVQKDGFHLMRNR